MELLPINTIFNIEKGSLQSSKCIEGEYDFITASSEWKTHNEYTHECEALIFAMGAAGSLGRTHYANGKFIASDLCFILTPKEAYIDKVDLRYYYYFFNASREKIVKALATGTTKLAINQTRFSKYMIPFLDIDRQKELKKLYDRVSVLYHELHNRLERQSGYITKLRQSILLQAVEGKLCEQNPADEPASNLLKHIKAEKDRFIKEGIIKKGKPLSLITDEEKPFDLPIGWEWCRLGDLTISVKDGPHYSPQYSLTGIPFISGRNVSISGVDFSTAKYITPELNKELAKRCSPQKGDILYTKGGETGIATVNKYDIKFNVWVHVAVLTLSKYVYNYYLCDALNSTHCYQLSQKYTHGTGNRDLGLTRMIKITIPLPPIAEQKRIVEKVNNLMAYCDELEKQVNESKAYAEKLIQSVFAEAFNAESQKKSVAEVIAIAPQIPLQPIKLAARGSITEETMKHIERTIDDMCGDS